MSKRAPTKINYKTIVMQSVIPTFRKLNPIEQIKNPVMFIVLLGSILCTGLILYKAFQNETQDLSYTIQVTIWLWLTVLFANFSESVAEGRSKTKSDELKRTRKETPSKRLMDQATKTFETVPSSELKRGDCVVCYASDVIPLDGEVIEGSASVDESAITGESAPVIRESGGDRSAVTGGTRVLSDWIVVEITAEPGKSFLDKMISLVEGATRQKTPNEIALSILLICLTVVFFVSVFTLFPFSNYLNGESGTTNTLDIFSVIGLLVCLIPTTIAALLSAIGISGMDRLLKKNVVALSGKAVETAGDIDVLLLDKTGTITLGNRQAVNMIAAPSVNDDDLIKAAYLSSLADETPEGRSILNLAKGHYRFTSFSLEGMRMEKVAFSAKTQMSGINFADDQYKPIRKGSMDAIDSYVKSLNGTIPAATAQMADQIAESGGTPLLVAEGSKVLGVIHLKDIVKEGINQRFRQLRRMGIRTIMITGDNPMTAAAIAAESGVDDFIAEATPEAKLKVIRDEQEKGHLVAMIGDGTNDAPSLAQSDVGVAMNTGTQVAREACNMIDLDSDPTKLIEIVETGKQILMTRGALTTFSIANDIAKYFAILPALFGIYYATGLANGPLSALNIMALQSPHSAILSAVIFNAIIIILLIPLALKGVKYRPLGANTILIRNLLIYGLGGIIVPFIGIKLIDMIINFLHLV